MIKKNTALEINDTKLICEKCGSTIHWEDISLGTNDVGTKPYDEYFRGKCICCGRKIRFYIGIIQVDDI